MGEMLARVAAGVTITNASPKLLIGTGSEQRHLLVVVTSDRGLCGGFNGNLVRLARQEIARLVGEGKDVQIVTVGRKARDLLKRDHGQKIIESFTGIGGSSRVSFAEANQVTELVLDQFEAGNFDVCSLIYNNFKSVLTQEPRAQQIIPFKLPEQHEVNDNEKPEVLASPYSFEPEENEILGQLLPRNIGCAIVPCVA